MNKILFLTLVFAFNLYYGSASAEPSELATINGKPGTYLYVMASYAPLEYVSGGVVSIRDSRGKTIATGKTNTRGAFVVPLVVNKFKNLPLRVTITGGKIISQNGDLYTGPKFKGHLRGQITAPPQTSSTSLYVDFLTTAASAMTSKKISYEAGFKRVRDALGITPDESMSVLRYVNSHAGNLEIKREVAKAKGYDRLVKAFAGRVRDGDKIGWLKPSRESWDQMVSALSDAHLASDTAKPLTLGTTNETADSHALASNASAICAAPLSNGKESGGLSTESIVQFGVLAAKDLMAFVKVPGGGFVEGIVGMLFSGIPTGSDPTLKAIERVQAQLACISSQVLELNSEILDLSFKEAVQPALECKDSVETQFTIYRNKIEAAMPNDDGTSSAELDPSYQALKKQVDSWGPKSNLVDHCGYGSKINNMLFANNASGQASAWRQLNIKLQFDFIWYTQKETQQLQKFLAYWSTILYEEFVLTNEYHNYMGEFREAEKYAGADPQHLSPYCKFQPYGDYKNYCVFTNNINYAYPADLYSDEIAIPDTGNAVVPYPAGLPIGVGQLGLNLSYIVKNSSGRSNEYFAKTAAAAALAEWNDNVYQKVYRGCSEEIKKEDSVVETFDCPKTVRTNAYENDYWRLGSNNPDGQSPAAFLLSAINQSPRSEWKNLDPSGIDISFWTYDQWSHFVSISDQIQDKTLVALGSMVNRGEVWADCVKEDFDYFGAPLKCVPNQPPVMGVLLGRTWWEGASKATKYVPPPPTAYLP